MKKTKLEKKINISPHIFKKRTRGKTLDLKNLGIIRERRLETVYHKLVKPDEVSKEVKVAKKDKIIEKPAK